MKEIKRETVNKKKKSLSKQQNFPGKLYHKALGAINKNFLIE